MGASILSYASKITPICRKDCFSQGRLKVAPGESYRLGSHKHVAEILLDMHFTIAKCKVSYRFNHDLDCT